MTTRADIVTFDPVHPEQAFARCAAVVRRGGVIAYPTDTFYALGADPRDPAAVGRLFEIKCRRHDQPILLLIADQRDVPNWAGDVTHLADRMMARFWPGPLTMVFRARPDVLDVLTGGAGTIGLRVPGHDTARALLGYLGAALTGTSANRSGGPSPRTAGEVMDAVGDQIDLVLDGGRTAGGMPSTIVDVSSGIPRIIREGAVPARDVLG